jgi:integrase/recombinase XerD
VRVTIFTRHSADCERKEERDYTRCRCAKWLEYYDATGTQIRKSAHARDLSEAQKTAADIEAQYNAIVRGEQPKPKQSGKTLADAIALYIDSKRGHVTEKHIAKLTYRFGELETYCAGQNLIALAAIQTEHILAWRNQLTDAQNTRAKKVFMVIGFFEFCVEMGWLTRNIARAQAVIVPYNDEQTPRALDDKQFAQYFASIPKMNGRSTDQQRAAFASLVMLMRWTGLSIRDAVTIERSKFEKNGQGFWQLFLRRSKTGKPVYCTLSEATHSEIMKGAKKRGRYLFVDSLPITEKGMNNMVQSWGEMYQKLADVAKITDEQGEAIRPTSHWMRHSFVFWCLQNDLPTEDIAMLLGDTLAIVAKHYSDWITGRQERLTERMILALSK